MTHPDKAFGRVPAWWGAAFLALAASAWGASPFNVRLDEPADRAAESVRWPVSVGVPFADGAIRQDARIALSDPEGKAVPVQTKVLGEWRTGAKTPKWVLLDFQADIRRGATPLFRVLPDTATEPARGIRIAETADDITVDTGAVTFRVSKTNFSLLDSLSVNGGRQVLKASSLYWVRDNGRLWLSRTYPRPDIVVETAGPQRAVIRAEGWYTPEPGWKDRMMRYQVRIAAFAGLPYVRIYHTLIWTNDDNVVMREFGLSFDVAQPAKEGRVGVGAEAFASPVGKMEAAQDKFQNGRIIVGDRTYPIKELSGWAEIRGDDGGIAVSVKDLAFETPKAFTATDARLTAHLWAPQSGVMSMKLEDRLSPEHAEGIKKNPAWAEWTSSGITHVSPQGAAKTHEIWIWPTAAAGPSVEAVNDLVQRPIAAMADPVYQCSTGAIPYLQPKSLTPPEYRYVEEGLDGMFRHVAQPHDFLNDYSMWSFGDVHLFGSSPWRAWDCGGYNWPSMSWLLFYRSGERHYLESGIRNARHVMDVDVCHHGAEEGPAYTKVKGYICTYSPWHWAWGPSFDAFNSHPQYLMYYYYLTGYERAADVLRLIAQANKWGTLARGVTLDARSVSREHYGRINTQAVYHEFTGDPTHLENALAWARSAIAVRNPDGKFANNTFWGWIYTGLDRAYRQSGDPALRDSVLTVLKNFAEPPKDALTAPSWNQETMAHFAFAWQMTGNENYLRYPVARILDQMTVTQREGSIAWSGGPGFSSLPRNHFPSFMEGALYCLGAWASIGFKDMPAWPGNNAYFPSLTVRQDTFQSAMTMFVRKEAGKGGALLLTFKESNLRAYEDFKGKRVEARITAPDGRVRALPITGRWEESYGSRVLLGPQPVPIALAPDEPAGEYRVEIVSEQPLFWICPKTDLPGLVVHVPEGKLGLMVYLDPCKYFIRLKPGVEKLGLAAMGGTDGAKPLTVLDPAGGALRMFRTEDPDRIVVDIPEAARGRPLALLKGPVSYYMAGPPPQGVAMDGAYDYVAVDAAQWFLPAAAQGGLF